MNQQQHKRLAIDFLQATRTARGYRYRAHETSSDWVVSARDLARLGKLLDAADTRVDCDDPTSAASAYDRWCAQTNAVEVSR